MADVRPAGIVTVEGSKAPEGLLESEIGNPPVGAGPLIVTVPVEEAPALTDVGLSFSETRVGGVIVKVAVSTTVPCVAVMVAVT